jgi:uncharacterized membrane protein
MTKSRLEAFSDGVLAIVITVMVLELRPPEGATFESLFKIWPTFLSYVLSFTYVAIYWNNHHHMLHAAKRVSGGVLWANMHLLFWLSLVPFTTAWMGDSHFASVPVAVYGGVLLMAAAAYWVLQRVLVSVHGPSSVLAHAFRRDLKGNLSLLFYLTAVLSAFWAPAVSEALYVLVALMWLVPDSRIERALKELGPQSDP